MHIVGTTATLLRLYMYMHVDAHYNTASLVLKARPLSGSGLYNFLSLGVSEQAPDGIPQGFGIVVEDKPSCLLSDPFVLINHNFFFSDAKRMAHQTLFVRTYVWMKCVRHSCIGPIEVAVVLCVERCLLLSSLTVTIDFQLFVDSRPS